MSEHEQEQTRPEQDHASSVQPSSGEVSDESLESVAGGTSRTIIDDGCTVEPIRCWEPPVDATGGSLDPVPLPSFQR